MAVLFIAAFVLGIVLFAPFAVQVTLGQDFLPNRIGVASGVTLGLAVSVGGLATPLFGLLADSSGLTITLAAIAVVPAAACALSFLVRDPRPDATECGSAMRPPIDSPLEGGWTDSGQTKETNWQPRYVERDGCVRARSSRLRDLWSASISNFPGWSDGGLSALAA